MGSWKSTYWQWSRRLQSLRSDICTETWLFDRAAATGKHKDDDSDKESDHDNSDSASASEIITIRRIDRQVGQGA